MAWEKSVSQKDAVKAFLVVTDGKVDVAASTEKYRAAALRHMAGQEAEDNLITECLTELFDRLRGAHLNLDYIKSQTVQSMIKRVPDLNDPNLFTQLSGRVEEVLHANTNQPAVEAKGDKPAREAITGRIYNMRKGKGGGFVRISDEAPAVK